MFISIGSVIIDDIVLPDGTTHMGCMGGGSVHAIMGMRVWSDQVGLVGNIGHDFPPELLEKLTRMFNLQGLIKKDKKTVRAWQIFENDGTRTEIFRSDFDDFLLMEPEMSSFPDDLNNLEGVHLLSPMKKTPEWIHFLRQRGNPFILWEPWDLECEKENLNDLKKALPLMDCFSPNYQEAQRILGPGTPDVLLDKFLSFGAKMIVIRMGAEGSIFADADGNRIQVPIVKVKEIVDQTGAGNAYCGGLVVGMSQAKDPVEALCKAAVSASFPLEQFGALFPIENVKEIAEQRFQACMKMMAE